jgi:hypothetical protein
MGKDSIVNIVTDKDLARMQGKSEETAFKQQSAHS